MTAWTTIMTNCSAIAVNVTRRIHTDCERKLSQIQQSSFQLEWTDTMGVPPEKPVHEFTSEDIEAWCDLSGAPKVQQIRQIARHRWACSTQTHQVPRQATSSLISSLIHPEKRMRYRSRWVAKQLNTTDAEEWFATTPPIEALKTAHFTRSHR